MSAHTPGPLAAKRDRQGRYMEVRTARGVTLATVYGSDATDPNDCKPLPAVANATLFSSAPEMLDALRAALAALRGLRRLAFSGSRIPIDRYPEKAQADAADAAILAAIAKAEGRS